MDKSNTNNDVEGHEIWQMTLSDAIRISLDTSEILRVISAGAQGNPIGGFEPRTPKTDASAVVTTVEGARA